MVGRDLERREDPALVTGQATYTDDLHAPDMAYLVFVRSRYGHAAIGDIDTSDAESIDGVLGVYTWEDIENSDTPGVIPVETGFLDHEIPSHPILAHDRVRYHGQPIAVVVADDRYVAKDGANAVNVNYDRLDAVTDPIEATAEDAPTIFENVPNNVVTVTDMGDSDATSGAFAEADHTVEVALENNRLIANAMEPTGGARGVRRRGRLADRDDDEPIAPRPPRKTLGHAGNPREANPRRRAERRRRVRTQRSPPSRRGRRGVVCPRTRSSREVDRHALGELPRRRARTGPPNDGRTGLRRRRHDSRPAGRNPRRTRRLRPRRQPRASGVVRPTAGQPVRHSSHPLPDPQRPDEHGTGPLLPRRWPPRGRLRDRTTRGPCGPRTRYRPRRVQTPQPASARRVSPTKPPSARTTTAATTKPHWTRRSTPWSTTNSEHSRRDGNERDDGRYLGVGLACFVESTGGGFESGVVRVHPDGGVTVYAGTHSHGQGHGTTYAQIVADELGVPYDDIDVVEGDTEQIPTGTGTFGSRSTIAGGNAVAESAGEVADKAQRIAADRLEAAPEDIVSEGGEFRVVGAPDRAIAFEEVASAAYGRQLPDGESAGLESTTFYDQDGTAYAFGVHAAVVAVDPESGEIEVERYVAVDDCGEQINPRIVEGQVHGGVAQGIGQALYEQAVYDDTGTLVTGSMQDYAIPKISQIPTMETRSTVTPSPTNPLGVKGIGEAGTMAAPPALVNAVLDALSPLGVESIDMPLTEETVWRAVREQG